MSHETPFWRIRAVLFWVHLVMGTTAGVVILVMSVTGAMLGFEREIVDAIDGAPKATVPAGAVRLPLDTLFARARLAPSDVSLLSIRRDPAEPVVARARARGAPTRLLDPYTGADLPRPTTGRAAETMQAVRRWHRFLGQENGRGVGRTLTGAANLLFVFLGLTGLWLWWPRRWTAAIVRSTTIPAFRLSAKAREFNWHHVAGIWLAIPIILVSASGVFLSYEWPQVMLGVGVGGGGEGRGGGPPAG
ncbi:MAG: PepSY domain-containing protein, partial [Gemmatimonadetes bacterium]|nr:PepSY domain-containing protein [Gemmatimonadota bacterium]